MTRTDDASRAGSAATATAPPAGDASPQVGGPATRLLLGLPDLVVCAVAGFSVGPMLLLLAGQFRMALVLPAGLVGAAVAVKVCGLPRHDTGEHTRRDVVWTAVAGLLILAWALYNARYTAENVYATRDPATYNITARWLMDHPSLHIHTQLDVFGSPARAIAEGAGFSDDGPGELYAQGNHLMPVFAAVVGWVFGIQGMFRVDVVLGALALVALFGLARRIVGAPLALLVTAAMAVATPMVYVSRDMYSEPLMMIFLMGGVALLHRATRSGRTVDYALSGLVSGCAAMVRIDSYAALLAVIVSGVVVVGLAREHDRRAAVRHGVALVGAAAAATVLGLLDVSRLSAGYFHDQRRNITLELAAAVFLLVVGPVVARVLWRPRVRTWLTSDAVRRRVSTGAVAGLVAVFLLLLSRPLWLTGHWSRNRVLEIWQAQAGVAVDGTRTYNERTVLWLAQYLGWATVLLAVAGYALLISRAVRRRDDALVGLLTMGLTMSALYLWTAQITPDQPWAMRRYVPVVLPLLLVAAAAALRQLAAWRPAGLAAGRAAVVVLGVLMVVEPLRVTLPVRHLREQVPMYGQVQAICRAIDDRGAVVAVDQEALAQYAMTMRAYCGVPAIGVPGASPQELRAIARDVRAHGRTPYVLGRDRAAMAYAVGGPAVLFDTVPAELWPNAINRPPRKAGLRPTEVFLARIGADGRIEQLPPAR